MNSRHGSIASWVLIAALFSPFLVLLGNGFAADLPRFDIWARAWGFTLLQATLSAFFAVVFGLIGALGLQWSARSLSQRTSRAIEFFVMLPSMVPVLFFLLAVFKFMPFARGIAGIVFVHAALNTGLVAIAVSRAWTNQVSRVADLAWLEGSSRLRFFSKIAVPMIKNDLVTVFLFVFSLSFTSFAVPLMIGGSAATTMEVLIYQFVRISGDWSIAIGLSLIQFVSVALISLFLSKLSDSSYTQTLSQKKQYTEGSPLLSLAPGLLFAALPTALLVAGLIDRPWVGIERALEMETLASELLRGLFGSLAVAALTASLVLGALLTLAYYPPAALAKKLLLGFVAPSSVLTGLGILILWRATGFITYVKISLALTLVSLPSFYRLRWSGVLDRLAGQRQLAVLLGADSVSIFKKIVLPQVIRPAMFLAGLSAFWAWGDFALSSVIAERDVTAAMTVQSLLESYRFEIATSLVWLLIVGGAVTFFIFEGAGRVLGQEPEA